MTRHKIKYVGEMIVLSVHLKGNLEYVAKFALDTGSTRTLVKPDVLKVLGYDLKNRKNTLTVTTGSTNEKAFEQVIESVSLFGVETTQLNVVCKSLPTGLFFIDGLLGLDFFQKIRKTLLIDFQTQEISLE